MRNEIGYICFNLLAGIALLAAGYFVDSLFAVVGVLVMSAAILVCVVTKFQNRAEEHALWEDAAEYTV